MVHKLAIIAVIGLTTSAVCMGAAAAIGGREFGKDFDGIDLSMFRRSSAAAKPCKAPAPPVASWIGMAATMSACRSAAMPTMRRAATTRCMSPAIPRCWHICRIRDGNIELDCNGWHRGDSALEITLPGQEFRKFGIAGSGNLVLQKSEPEQAEGQHLPAPARSRRTAGCKNTEIHIAGSGDADLGPGGLAGQRGAHRRQRQHRHRPRG